MSVYFTVRQTTGRLPFDFSLLSRVSHVEYTSFPFLYRHFYPREAAASLHVGFLLHKLATNAFSPTSVFTCPTLIDVAQKCFLKSFCTSLSVASSAPKPPKSLFMSESVLKNHPQIRPLAWLSFLRFGDSLAYKTFTLGLGSCSPFQSCLLACMWYIASVVPIPFPCMCMFQPAINRPPVLLLSPPSDFYGQSPYSTKANPHYDTNHLTYSSPHFAFIQSGSSSNMIGRQSTNQLYASTYMDEENFDDYNYYMDKCRVPLKTSSGGAERVFPHRHTVCWDHEDDIVYL